VSKVRGHVKRPSEALGLTVLGVDLLPTNDVYEVETVGAEEQWYEGKEKNRT